MSTPLVKVFWIGNEVPETQILSSASRSNVAGGLHGEMRDAPVRHGVVLHLLAGDPLLVDEEETPVGEEDGVAYEQVRGVHLLALAQQSREVLLRRRRIDGVRVPEQCHVGPPCT